LGPAHTTGGGEGLGTGKLEELHEIFSVGLIEAPVWVDE